MHETEAEQEGGEKGEENSSVTMEMKEANIDNTVNML